MNKLIALVVLLVVAATQATKPNICGRYPPFCKRSRYRSFDGSCNNLNNPQWGSAFSAYARFVRNSYADGIHEFPRSCTNESLPNPRDISLQVFPDVLVIDPCYTVITLQWGQIVAHDMSFTSEVPQTGVDDIVCCTNGEPIPPRSEFPDPRCAPIRLPKDDPYNAPEGNTCINFVRTASNLDEKCDVPGKTVEPISAVTAYHDLSIVYGSSLKQSKTVRTGKSGQLACILRKGQTWLPQAKNVTFACNVQCEREPCYYAGDIRVNQNPQLALLQTILMREHNLIAKKLNAINPHWDDERCFQETRRIMIAKAQHITYYEFIPIFLGAKNVVEKKLSYPNANGYVNDYEPYVNAQTLNEHATAAYRGFHTMIVGYLKKFTECRKFANELRLSDWYNRPSIIEKNTGDLTRGMSTQQQNAVDRYYDDEIRQYFFRPLNESLGQDMRAIDIKRARDHGLGTYVDVLEACGLGKPKCFSDLEKYMTKDYVKLLKRVYTCVEDVELAVGGQLETKVSGTLAGPTFLCIMTKQFYRTRVGDRYFYENGNTDGAFTPEQLDAIRKTSMSRILCDNVPDVDLMQPNAFEKISKRNALVPCNMLPQVDLQLWKESFVEPVEPVEPVVETITK